VTIHDIEKHAADPKNTELRTHLVCPHCHFSFFNIDTADEQEFTSSIMRLAYNELDPKATMGRLQSHISFYSTLTKRQFFPSNELFHELFKIQQAMRVSQSSIVRDLLMANLTDVPKAKIDTLCMIKPPNENELFLVSALLPAFNFDPAGPAQTNQLLHSTQSGYLWSNAKCSIMILAWLLPLVVLFLPWITYLQAELIHLQDPRHYLIDHRRLTCIQRSCYSFAIVVLTFALFLRKNFFQGQITTIEAIYNNVYAALLYLGLLIISNITC
ncbi:MAG: hypothetical protein K5Q00_07295, partial [Gammaproteobacteria bacterium]|nr:hypothetical protein [Gammaproteobacteria bacterium]